MKVKITKADGTVIEAEGTKEELTAVMQAVSTPCFLNHYPWPVWISAPYIQPNPVPWDPIISPTVTWEIQ